MQFETIHPFLDGNGRVGRLLIPLLLMQDGVLQQPLLYLSLYFKTHRARYYELLSHVRRSGDWESWLGFFADAVLLAATQAVQTARALTDLVATDRRRIVTLGRQAASAMLVFDAFSRRPVRSIASVCAETGQSAMTVGAAMTRLTDLGLLRELTGRRRGRVFGYLAYLDTLNREALFEPARPAKLI